MVGTAHLPDRQPRPADPVELVPRHRPAPRRYACHARLDPHLPDLRRDRGQPVRYFSEYVAGFALLLIVGAIIWFALRDSGD